jgi:lipopolysaccharide transport system ATP-binding protein
MVFDGDPPAAIEKYEETSTGLESLPWARSCGDPSHAPIRVDQLEVLSEDGQPRTVFEYGEHMRLRLHCVAPRPFANPNFVVSFMRSDNVACCNYNTAMDGFSIPSISGSAVIEVLTPPLKLVSEMYMIHLLVWDEKFQKLHSAQMGSTFHVKHDLLSTSFGVFHEPGQWSMSAQNQPGAPATGT